MPFVAELAAGKPSEVLRRNTTLGRGVNLYRGEVTHVGVAAAHGLRHKSLESLLSA